jgi:hypothetical protein
MRKQNLSRRRQNLLPIMTAAVIATGMCSGAATAATATPALAASQNSTANPGPSITGFRGATFGMTEAQVRAAITSTFNLPASAIAQATNPIERIQVLTVTVPNLIPNGGTASVSYMFGYQSHKLFQINAVWSQTSDPKMTPAQLDQNGQSLQQYFASEGFAHSSGGIATASGILLFRAYDQSDNAVLLILSGNIAKDPKSPDKSYLTPTTLTLSYAADALHPDIFQLPKGSF